MTRRIGAHELEIEGDLIKFTVHGDYSLEDLKAFAVIADAHEATHGYVLILNDINDATTMSAEVRRFTAERTRAAKLRGPIYAANASFGGSAFVRGIAGLFHAMLKLSSGGGVLTHLVKTEAEARAFLAVQRQRFQAQRKQS